MARWAKDNFVYVNDTEPFGEQVQPGAVDGYARIKGDHGFVFLFNGNPRPSEITFEVGDEINLQENGSYQFVELYPSERHKLVLDSNGRSVFAFGEQARIVVPANGCYLLELKRVTMPGGPVLVGAAGEVTLADGQMAVTGVAGKPGETSAIRVRVADPQTVQTVTVNGIAQKFARTEREICLELQFAGEKFVANWTRGPRPTGNDLTSPIIWLSPNSSSRPRSPCRRLSSNCWKRQNRRTSLRWTPESPPGRRRRVKETPPTVTTTSCASVPHGSG